MPEYDWSARLSTGELILCTATMAATTATAGVYAHLPALAPAAIGAAAAGAQAIYDARRGSTRMALVTRAASWLVAAGWTTSHVAVDTVPTSSGWITAACAAILITASNYAVNHSEPGRQHENALLSFKRQAVKTMDEWTERIERVTRIKGCTVLPSMKPWPEDAGYTLEVQLPTGGITHKVIAQHSEAFAADMALPDGCGVEIAKGTNRGRILIRVSTRDMISETVMYPEDFTELDMNDGFSFGFHRDATDARAALLDDCGIVIGDTGSGKTNLLNTVIAEFARMPNTLIWVIDTTGAGVALPWITPWALREDGRTDQACAPTVDWVANTVKEASVMLRMAIMIIAARKARYQKLMRKLNTDKIPISAEVPEILIIGDETAELPPEIQKLIDSGMNTGRAVRVRYLNSALRATQDTITVAMKKRAKLRIGMHTEDGDELAFMFTGYQVLDMADAPVPGSGFYTYGKGAPRPFKARRLEPDLITRCAIACGDRRPKLDTISSDTKLYPLYEGRWARAIPALYPDDTEAISEAAEDYLRDLTARGVDPTLTGNEGADDDDVQNAIKEAMGDAADMTGPITPEQLEKMFQAAGSSATDPTPDMADTVVLPVVPAPAAEPAPAEPTDTQAPTAGADEDAFGRVIKQTGEPAPPDPGALAPTAAAEPAPAEPPTPQTPTTAPDPGDFGRVIKQTGEPVLPDPGAPVGFVLAVKPPTLTPEARAYKLLYEAGADGTGAKEISTSLEEQNVTVPRTTVQRWLATWTEKNKAVRTGAGSHTRYVHASHTTREPSNKDT